MMKNFKYIILLLLASLPLFAYTPSSYNGLEITGIKGATLQLSMALDNTATLTSNGYSFSLQDSEIQYLDTLTNKTGKRFASWYLASNTNNITLTVSHTPLVSEIDSSIALDYHLALQYSKASPYNLYILSNMPVSLNFAQDEYYKTQSQVAITNYGLFFRLTTAFDTNNPGGYYHSTITLRVEAN